MEEHSTVLLFTGDLFFAGDGNLEDILSARLKKVLADSDYVVFNLEGVITSSDTKQEKTGPALRFNPDVLEVLSKICNPVFSLANNHIMDYGKQGFLDTIDALNRAGVQSFGAGSNKQSACSPLILKRDSGNDIALFACTEAEFSLADEKNPGAAWQGDPILYESLKQSSQSGKIPVLCTHGGLEYLPLPSQQRRNLLTDYVHCGAKLVIGNHVHQPQGFENILGTEVYYALGDFLFTATNGLLRDGVGWSYLVRSEISKSGEIFSSVILLEIADGVIDIVPVVNDKTSLHSLNMILRKDSYTEIWQEIAYAVFFKKHFHYLERNWQTFARRNSKYHKITAGLKKIFGFRKEELTQIHALSTLNLFRCESHRWLVESAMQRIASRNHMPIAVDVLELLKTQDR